MIKIAFFRNTCSSFVLLFNYKKSCLRAAFFVTLIVSYFLALAEESIDKSSISNTSTE
jgi:hypothetical protein